MLLAPRGYCGLVETKFVNQCFFFVLASRLARRLWLTCYDQSGCKAARLRKMLSCVGSGLRWRVSFFFSCSSLLFLWCWEGQCFVLLKDCPQWFWDEGGRQGGCEKANAVIISKKLFYSALPVFKLVPQMRFKPTAQIR